MQTEDRAYISGLGELMANIQSLEFMIRIALYKNGSRPHKPFMVRTSFLSLDIGKEVPENALTDYSTLKQLISRYNREISKSEPSLNLSSNLVEIRDVLAHGRIAFEGGTNYSTDRFIAKFSDPKKDRKRRVFVAYAEKMSLEWIKEKNEFVRGELDKIQKNDL